MITIQELNTLLPTIYLSKQLEKVDWGNVSDEDKQALITQAVAYMTGLRYRGRYKEEGQEIPFPRIINNVVVEVNDNVRKAVASIVYDLLESTTNGRKELQRHGVKSINTGGVSESYKEEIEEVSDKYKQFIEKYLFNGVL